MPIFPRKAAACLQSLGFLHAAVLHEALDELFADGHHGIEGCHRILEYDADLAAPDVLDLLVGERHQVANRRRRPSLR